MPSFSSSRRVWQTGAAVYLPQPQGVVFHGRLQVLQLLGRPVGLGGWRVPLSHVGIAVLLGGASPARVHLGQDEGVAAGALLDAVRSTPGVSGPPLARTAHTWRHGCHQQTQSENCEPHAVDRCCVGAAHLCWDATASPVTHPPGRAWLCTFASAPLPEGLFKRFPF